MPTEELRPGLFRLILGRYQAHLLRDEASPTLVDTGEAGSLPLLESALGELGTAPADIDRVVLTHFHDDHAGNAAEIRSLGHAVVIAHGSDAAYISGSETGPPPRLTDVERELHSQVAAGLQPAPPVPVDITVGDGVFNLDAAEAARSLARLTDAARVAVAQAQGRTPLSQSG